MIKRNLLILIMAISTIAFSQEKEQVLSVGHELSLIIASKVEIPTPESAEPEPSRWTGGTRFQAGFSQLSLTNWASGGYDNIALNTHVNIYRNYNVLEDMFWENRLQMAYGFVQSFGEGYKKSDDKFMIDSKLGYRAINNFFASATFSMRTQMTNGFTYPKDKEPVLVSSPFSPAYFSLGVGMDYKPVKPLAINFSLLTGNLVIVDKRELRTKYGNDIDKSTKWELGAQLKIDYKHQITEKLNITSTLNLFSDYLDKPQNIKVYWDLNVDSKINEYFSVNIRTNLIYDDNIMIEDDNGIAAPRVQFKEILSIGFSYTIGDFKK
jgi:hypothetical protein